MATKSTATDAAPATVKVAKPRTRKAAAPKVVKSVTIVRGTRNPRITRVSRVLVERETNVKLPKGTNAERATVILNAAGFTVEVVTWSQAAPELRSLLGAIADEDGGDDE